MIASNKFQIFKKKCHEIIHIIKCQWKKLIDILNVLSIFYYAYHIDTNISYAYTHNFVSNI